MASRDVENREAAARRVMRPPCVLDSMMRGDYVMAYARDGTENTTPMQAEDVK